MLLCIMKHVRQEHVTTYQSNTSSFLNYIFTPMTCSQTFSNYKTVFENMMLVLNVVMNLMIYLVRHAKTDWNDKGIWQGNVDIPLNEEGFRQAERLAERFSSMSIQSVYTSPLKRSYQTAEVIAKRFSISPIKEPLLRECEISLWNGLTMKQTLEKYADLYHEWSCNPKAQIQGVEPLEKVQERMIEALENITHSPFENIVVVSHAIAIRMLICWILRLPIQFHKNFRLENASITAVEFASQPRILYLNDMCHLEK